MPSTEPNQVQLNMNIKLDINVVAPAGQSKDAIRERIETALVSMLSEEQGALRDDFGATRDEAITYFSDPQNEPSPVWGGYDGPMVTDTRVSITHN